MSPSKSRKRRPRKQKSNTKKILLVVALLVVVSVAVVAYIMLGNSGSTETVEGELVLLETSMGNITIELRTDMPITTENFKNLIQQGAYDGTIFHRVVNLPNNLVIIQGGDPTTGNWMGGTIPNIQDEFSETPANNKNVRGTIAMANTGEENSGSSQFFINGAYNSHLDNKHPVFGEVIEGMDVVDNILDVATDSNAKPLEDVILIRAQLLD